MTDIIIPDVSFYQDANSTPQGIDFEKMASQTPAVIIRAGQRTWIDEDFAFNWQAAKDVGLVRGSYWFYDSRTEPEAQAKLWAEALGDDLGEGPLCLDLEENYGGQWGTADHWRAMLEYMKRHIPGKADHIMIYTAYYYFVGKTNYYDRKDLFAQYPLWVANYGADTPRIPPPWSDYMLWQYTATGDGALYGVESRPGSHARQYPRRSRQNHRLNRQI
jgi:lysozyme